MLALWRVLLRAILKERDEHLAQRIREACGGQGRHGEKRGWSCEGSVRVSDRMFTVCRNWSLPGQSFFILLDILDV